MKILRTSFAHLVREKILQGEDTTLPPPVLANDIVPARMNTNAVDGKLFDKDFFGGSLLYREQDTTFTDAGGNVFKNQGPVGFGPPPVGPGTKPYYTMLTNATPNTVADGAGGRGIYTGKSSESPHIPEARVYIKGDVGAGITFSTGQLEQSYTDSTGTITDIECGNGRHVLISLDHRLRSSNQLTGAGKNLTDPYALDDTTIPSDVNNAIHFVFETTGATTYKLYAVRGNWNGYNHTGNVDSFPFVTTQPDFVYLQNSYKRMLPVHFLLRKDGTGEFRVDTSILQFNLTSMPSADGSTFVIPTGLNSGDDHMSYRLGGLNPKTYTGPVVQGMTAPLVIMGNVAVNDTRDDDGQGHTGLPPFIAGIPMTPIRRDSEHDNVNNERPVSVIDTQAASGGDDAWLSYSYSGNPVTYANPLEAVVDGQMYETRGVATKALSADLDINLSYTRIKARHADINAVNIEAINIAVENAAVFNPEPDKFSLALKIEGDTGLWSTDYKAAKSLTSDSELDSHVTFFNKYSTLSNSVTGFALTDFNTQATIKTRAMETIHIK